MNAPVTLDRKAFLGGAGMLVVAFGCAPGVRVKGKNASEANPLGVKTYPHIDSWLTVDAHGGVTVLFGKVELGTGVETAIAQLAADGLDVAFDRVSVVQGDTARTPDQGYTAGSQTLTSGAIAVYQAAAEARRLLMTLGARHLEVAANAVSTRAGAVFVTRAPARSVNYGALLAGHHFAHTFAADAPKQPSGSGGWTGKAVPRVDIPGKMAGTFAYVQNLRLTGMLHGRVVMPSAPGAKLQSYDVSSLADIPEVVTVVRRGNLLGVVAKSEWSAIRAAQELKVNWSAGIGLPDETKLADIVRSTPGSDRQLISSGDVDAVIKNARRSLTADYQWPFQTHGSIGPSCAIANVEGQHAEIWSATQGVFPLRGAIAQMLGVTADKVRVRFAEGAGCYGHNGADDVAGFAAVFSQAVHAPVRVQYMRGDETGWDPKGVAMAHTLRGALDESGNIAAWDMHVWTPTHNGRPDGLAGNLLPGQLAGAPVAPITFVGGDRNAPNNYTIPVQRITITDQKTAVLRQSAMRGLGAPQNTFANESFVDELAHLAGADPFAFRLAHVKDDRTRAVFEAVRNDYQRGRGVSFTHYENNQAIVVCIADVDVDTKTGVIRVNHLWAAHDCGLIVNPDGLRNQIEGNMVQGTSRALKEIVNFDAQRVLSVDWASYPILTFSEVPDVTVYLIDRPSERILGAGEAATTIVAPAIANAVFAKTGIRLRRVPFTPQNVLAARSAG